MAGRRCPSPLQTWVAPRSTFGEIGAVQGRSNSLQLLQLECTSQVQHGSCAGVSPLTDSWARRPTARRLQVRQH